MSKENISLTVQEAKELMAFWERMAMTAKSYAEQTYYREKRDLLYNKIEEMTKPLLESEGVYITNISSTGTLKFTNPLGQANLTYITIPPFAQDGTVNSSANTTVNSSATGSDTSKPVFDKEEKSNSSRWHFLKDSTVSSLESFIKYMEWLSAGGRIKLYYENGVIFKMEGKEKLDLAALLNEIVNGTEMP